MISKSAFLKIASGIIPPGTGKGWGWACCLVVVFGLGLQLWAQSQGSVTMIIPGVHAGPNVVDEKSPTDRLAAKRVVQLNDLRQKSLVSDAEKLLRLAQELNDDASAEDAKMSQAERLHKAAEIQKLAKDVKEKMTYAIGAPDASPAPFAVSR